MHRSLSFWKVYSIQVHHPILWFIHCYWNQLTHPKCRTDLTTLNYQTDTKVVHRINHHTTINRHLCRERMLNNKPKSWKIQWGPIMRYARWTLNVWHGCFHKEFLITFDFQFQSFLNITVPLRTVCFTHYQSENTATNVLSQMQTQRQQLQGAHDNVWEMRQAADKAKKDITALVKKAREKKFRLQIIVIVLATIDFLLFVRLLQCGGSFFCRRRGNYNNDDNGYYNWW